MIFWVIMCSRGTVGAGGDGTGFPRAQRGARFREILGPRAVGAGERTHVGCALLAPPTEPVVLSGLLGLFELPTILTEFAVTTQGRTLNFTG